MTDWLIFAIISFTSVGFLNIVHRFVIKEHDWLSYSFIEGIIATLFFIPMFIASFSFPADIFGFYVLILGVFLWTLAAIVTFKSFQIVEASARSPLKQTQIIFILILSYFLLGEALTFNKVIGSLLIFLGVILISYKKGKTRLNFDKGFQLTLLSALIAAIVSLVDKVASTYWNVASYSFMVYLFPSLILGVLAQKRKEKLVKMLKTRYLFVILAGFLEFSFFLTRMIAFSLADLSIVSPVLRLSTLVTVVCGIILLKERQRIREKIFSAILMILGAIIIAL
jgi:transporter family protein